MSRRCLRSIGNKTNDRLVKTIYTLIAASDQKRRSCYLGTGKRRCNAVYRVKTALDQAVSSRAAQHSMLIAGYNTYRQGIPISTLVIPQQHGAESITSPVIGYCGKVGGLES